jgi:hypothetical protein
MSAIVAARDAAAIDRLASPMRELSPPIDTIRPPRPASTM